MVFYIVLNSNWLIGKSGTSKAAKALFSIKIDWLRMQPYPLSWFPVRLQLNKLYGYKESLILFTWKTFDSAIKISE